jgi:YD repeat-containing protein
MQAVPRREHRRGDELDVHGNVIGRESASGNAITVYYARGRPVGHAMPMKGVSSAAGEAVYNQELMY